MAVLPILSYPHPGLETVSAPVERFDAALARLAEDLAATMRAAPGIGITGAHCGIFSRITVLELAPESGLEVYVNPQVIWSSAEKASAREGSVSMPGVVDMVERPARVRVAYRTLDGTPAEIEADGLRAVCLQHEIDQMDGIFWLQRLSRLKRDRLLRKWRKHGG